MTNGDDIFDITPVFFLAITQNQPLAEMRLEVGTIPEVHPIFFSKVRHPFQIVSALPAAPGGQGEHFKISL